jgi:TPR repeat protein
MRKTATKTWARSVVFAAVIALVSTLHAADDTSRFFGTWKATFPYNGQTVTIVSFHDSNGFKNYFVLPSGNSPAGDGTFSAANGRYTTSAAAPNNAGTYRFINSDTILCTNAAGQSLTWKRDKTSQLPAQPEAAEPQAAPQPAAAPAAPAYDPSLPPEVNAGNAAVMRKDYNTAWRDYMPAAQQGNSDAQAAIGAMLFLHTNPPGTGFYLQCEKWLLASAKQGNPHGMDLLAQYYYATGVATAGGINPGINNAPIPPALRRQAEARFALARQWYERSVEKGDGYAMGYLAVMLDSGIGGPADPARAAELRAQMKQSSASGSTDRQFVKAATTDPETRAMAAAWQSGHYADALAAAKARAAKGDAAAEALLGRAYYEGVGVPRNYSTALSYLNPAVAQNNPDAMFILGLMYEWGRGVGQNLQKALDLFDRAAAMGQGYAKLEAGGMRMEGEAAAQVGRYRAQCASRGGVYDGETCTMGGMPFDPY